MSAMTAPKEIQSEARWPVLFALLALGLLNFALPPTLIVGPRWVVLVVLLVLVVPTVLAHRAQPRVAHARARLRR